MTLPADVTIRALTMNRDARGSFTEVFRREWDIGVSPIQWNVVQSQKGTLRGVHVHIKHDDYLILLSGKASVGLRDLRPGSPTEGLSTVVELDGDEPVAVVIPHGVAHGFLFHAPSLHLYAVSEYWNVADELACHWADPELELDWSAQPTLVSERDATAPSLAELLLQLAPSPPVREAASVASAP
jgi:dTDP-4-dehydrorhamnose 3,5-epimerase